MSSRRASATSVLLAGGLTIAVVLAAAGCSADVTRFSLGSVGTTGAIPTPLATTKAPALSLGLQRETPLPPVSRSDDYKVVGRDYGLPPASQPPPAQYVAPVLEPSIAAPPPSSETVEVQAGDTIYGIARRHGIAVAAIKQLNGLKSHTLRPGQRLALPAKAAKAAPPWADSKGAKHREFPVGRSEPASAPPLPPRVVQIKPRIIRTAPEEPKAPEPSQKTAKRGDVTTNALPLPAVATGKLRWPLRGKVIVGFGPQPDGSRYEGINLAAPLGTDVHAAEAGTVHYASDGVKGYGNLILIRHASDWSTAYGYVDQVLVKAKDVVKRGQVIAKVGKSGPVGQPQLRFEVRQNSVPVDPLPHLPN